MHFLPKDLICFSHLRWGFVYQRPQHLMSRFARRLGENAGRVIFWEEPLFEPEAEVSLSVWTCHESGVRICTPRFPAGAGEDAVSQRLHEMLDEYMERESITDFTAWYYTPMMLAFTHHLRPVLTVYDCMDELSLFKGAPPSLREREEHLFRRADLVFTGGHSLYEVKKKTRTRTFTLSRAALTSPISRRDAPDFPTPRIRPGFHIRASAGAALSMNEWMSICFAGSQKPDPICISS
jgi:UDP-galactopyranose mutase